MFIYVSLATYVKAYNLFCLAELNVMTKTPTAIYGVIDLLN